VVLRPEAIRERLKKLEDVIARLGDLGSSERLDLVGDYRDAWTAERGLQLAAEIAFDVGNHILSAHFGTSSTDYEDIIKQLAERGVISRELSDRFKGLGGFRNVLVHGYLRIDSRRVGEALERAPRDFSLLLDEVRRWLETALPERGER
jgi:uncharacterized protein YutE (UPF0331/DUF86 family)